MLQQPLQQLSKIFTNKYWKLADFETKYSLLANIAKYGVLGDFDLIL